MSSLKLYIVMVRLLKVSKERLLLLYFLFLIIFSFASNFKGDFYTPFSTTPDFENSCKDRAIFQTTSVAGNQLDFIFSDEVLELKTLVSNPFFSAKREFSAAFAYTPKELSHYLQNVQLKDRENLYDLYCDWQFDI